MQDFIGLYVVSVTYVALAREPNYSDLRVYVRM